MRPTPATDHRPLRVVRATPATVGEVVDRWIDRLWWEGCRSLVDYRSFARFHVLRWGHDLPTSQTLTEAEARAYLQARRLDGYEPETLWSIAYSWKALLLEIGVAFDVAALKLPRRSGVSRYAADALTAVEFSTLVRSRRGPLFLRLLAAIALFTGARASEVRGLRWCDLDRTGDVWVLRWDEQLHAKTLRRTPTKDSAAREVPVHPELRALLEQALEIYFRGSPPEDAPLALYLPPTGAGRRPSLRDAKAWTDGAASKAFGNLLKSHGLRSRPLAVARHTLPGLLLAGGADPLAVHSLTHPASLPRAAAPRSSSWGRYVHIPLEARTRAVLALHLPAVEVLTDAQANLPMESS